MRFRELDEDFFVAVGGAFPHCNTLAIFSDEIILIDPGCKLEDLRALFRSRGKDLHDVDTIILTHIHPDHIIHTTRIQRLSRCRIVTNDITAPLFNNKEKMRQFLGFHSAHPVRPHWEDLVNSKMYGALDDGRVDEIIKDREVYQAGEWRLRMMYTPGHTPDHMCIEILNKDILLAADIDCTEFGPFYGHPNSSIPQFKASIDKILNQHYKGIISSHLEEPFIEDYQTALAAYRRQFDIREDLVLYAIMDGADTINKIVERPLIYTNTSNIVYLQFERWMIEHHIKSLLAKKLITEERGRLKTV